MEEPEPKGGGCATGLQVGVFLTFLLIFAFLHSPTRALEDAMFVFFIYCSENY